MWQGDGASLAPGPKRCRVMTAVAAAATAAAPAAAAPAVAEAEAVVAMKRNVKDIKRELTWLGGSTHGLLEKSEFVEALLAAREAAKREAAAASPPEIVASPPETEPEEARATALPPTPSLPREVISLDEGEADERASAVGGGVGGSAGGAPLSEEARMLA